MVEAKTGAKRKLIDYRKNPPAPYNTKKVPLLKLADLFDVSLDYLVGRTNIWRCCNGVRAKYV